MALKQDASFQGVPITGAYHKINQVNVLLAQADACVTVPVYASKERAEIGLSEAIFSLSFPLTEAEIFALSGKRPPEGVEIPQIEASNPLEWCYKWLMTKPEFSKAEAV